MSTWLPLLGLGALLLAGGAARADGPVYGCTENDLDTALAQAGYVYFTQSCSITLTEPIEISQNTILDAQSYSVTIDGGGIGPIFQVNPGITFSNLGLTISGGANTNGGAYYILDGAFVTLTNCTVMNNSAAGLYGLNGINGVGSLEVEGRPGQNGTAGWPAQGGAIWNLGHLALLNCVLTNNSVTGGTGGQGGAGGAGYVAGGYSGGNGGNGGAGGLACGGAVYTAGQGTILASNCTFAANTVTGGAGGQGGQGGTGFIAGLAGGGGAGATAAGGGIYCNPNQAIVVNSTFFGNSVRGGGSAGGGTGVNGNGKNGKNGAKGLGGGLCCLGGGAVTNCTFYTNTVAGGAGGAGGDGPVNAGIGGAGGDGAGGGIYGTGLVSVVNCTLASCTALGGPAGTNGSGSGTLLGSSGAGEGGGAASGGGVFLVMNSMFSTNVVAPTNGPGTNIYAAVGKITDGGYNLTTDSSHLWTNSHTVKNTDPKVFSPALNGGYTMTMALSNSSPAIAAIPLTNPFPPIDQRGVHRPLGKGADIGAFELATFPAIIQQPANLVQTNGNAAGLSVSATGLTDERLYYQWRFYGTNTLSPTNVPAQIGATYLFTSLELTNVGYYDVIISNILGAVTSDVVSLSILPSITQQPVSVEVFEQTLALFKVTAIGETASGDRRLAYQWQFNNVSIPGAATNQVGTNFSYTLPSVDATNGGNYTVVITNAAGGITSAIVTLAVDAAPYIQPTNQTVAPGSPASFTVYASGEVPFTYQWQHDGTNLPAVGLTYTIPSVQESDAGPYVVVVSGDFNPAYARAYLGVGTLPAISGQPTNVMVPPGQEATFSVSATGGQLAYQWNFNGVPVPEATNASYSIPIVGPANVGPYTVTVSNSAGSVVSDQVQLSLAVVVAQPAIQASTLSNTFYLSFQSLTNLTYVIQYTDQLSDTNINWVSLATNNGTGGVITSSYPATNAAGGFYRIQVQ
jgi:hypothetical protein